MRIYDVIGVMNLPGGPERRYTVLGIGRHAFHWVDVIDDELRWFRVPENWCLETSA